MSLSFGIASWSLYLTDKEGLAPEQSPNIVVGEKLNLKAVPPMLRRRLNDFGKVCAAQFLAHYVDGEQLPVVYSSRHGDIQRTTDVLVALSVGEAVSPMHFSLAVHNAILGVLSIHTGNKSNASAIAFGDEGLMPVLLEGLGLLAQGHKKVMCIISDAPIPDEYEGFHSAHDKLFALAFVMSSGEVNFTLNHVNDAVNKSQSIDSPLAQVLAYVGLLDGQTSQAGFHLNGSSWCLSSTISDR